MPDGVARPVVGTVRGPVHREARAKPAPAARGAVRRRPVRGGATADAAHGRYRFSRAWGATLWAHPAQPDGIVWRSRLDDDQFCVALFDRCRGALMVSASEPLLADKPRFGALIERYRMAVIPDA